MGRIIPLEFVDVEKASEKLAQFMEYAVRDAVSEGIDVDRIGLREPDYDPFCKWMTVDGVAVCRFSLVPQPDEDDKGLVIAAHGTYLPAYRQFLKDEPEVLELTDGD